MLKYELCDDVSMEASYLWASEPENCVFQHRVYDCGVHLEISISEENKKIHLLFIKSINEGNGNGSLVMREIQNEYNDYFFILDAIPGRSSWYKNFGFVPIGVDVDMPAIIMAWSKNGDIKIDKDAEKIAESEIRTEDFVKHIVSPNIDWLKPIDV